MKILFSADFHLNIAAEQVFQQLQEVLDEENPELLVIAGDLATPSTVNLLYDLRRFLQRIGHDLPVAVTLGNHDFWVGGSHADRFPKLSTIMDTFWTPETAAARMTLLDRENLDLGSHVLVGGYGHYDFGFALPDLVIDGTKITEEHYLNGGFPHCVWNDFRMIPDAAKNLHREAKIQAECVTERMDRAIATGKRLLLALHTVPFPELNGHPVVGGNLSDMFKAYGGNSMLGREVAARAEHIDFLVCGHTHQYVPEQIIQGVRCLNIGAHYGLFRGVIFDTDDGSSRMVGYPLEGPRKKLKLRMRAESSRS